MKLLDAILSQCKHLISPSDNEIQAMLAILEDGGFKGAPVTFEQGSGQRWFYRRGETMVWLEAEKGNAEFRIAHSNLWGKTALALSNILKRLEPTEDTHGDH